MTVKVNNSLVPLAVRRPDAALNLDHGKDIVAVILICKFNDRPFPLGRDFGDLHLGGHGPGKKNGQKNGQNEMSQFHGKTLRMGKAESGPAVPSFSNEPTLPG
jgi:hypothetical protein